MAPRIYGGGMEPGELDLKAKTWTIPGRRTKNAHTHVVPLSAPAVAIIKHANPCGVAVAGHIGDAYDRVLRRNAGAREGAPTH